ncbi:hypothetical protein MSAN_00636200 [Mycena sanguinolenta]|uniref:Uncharacterized protein n=1 Tax=Mycena sanguinolenta TaxID=230812 RepID=A0A8H7DEH7_9AGAR|nr:hypothetical protein MSAN_00636200 [Mycena sanguinolenta]
MVRPSLPSTSPIEATNGASSTKDGSCPVPPPIPPWHDTSQVRRTPRFIGLSTFHPINEPKETDREASAQRDTSTAARAPQSQKAHAESGARTPRRADGIQEQIALQPHPRQNHRQLTAPHANDTPTGALAAAVKAAL